MDSWSGDTAASSTTVHRALDVLELLAREGRPTALAAIASSVHTPKATLHRLLATLQTRGYVVQEAGSGAYAMGPRCFELGSLWVQSLDLRTVAGPHLHRLNEQTWETVHLALYEGGEVIYVDKLDSRHPIIALSHVGRRCPATCVSTGRALVPFLPNAEIERVLASPLPAYTERTETDPERLRELFKEVRRTGYAVNRGSFRDGVCGIAAPVRDHTGAVVASIGCCVPESRFGTRELPGLRDATVAAAAAVSADLGWVLPRPENAALTAER